jgi:hypothetical protein
MGGIRFHIGPIQNNEVGPGSKEKCVVNIDLGVLYQATQFSGQFCATFLRRFQLYLRVVYDERLSLVLVLIGGVICPCPKNFCGWLYSELHGSSRVESIWEIAGSIKSCVHAWSLMSSVQLELTITCVKHFRTFPAPTEIYFLCLCRIFRAGSSFSTADFGPLRWAINPLLPYTSHMMMWISTPRDDAGNNIRHGCIP